MCGYLSQMTYARCTVPTWPEVVHSIHSSPSASNLPLTHTSILFFLPTQNALSPVLVCADSVAEFHSSICNNFVLPIFICRFLFFFLHMTCNFTCIYLVICFQFVYLFHCQCHVMSFHVLTIHCQISLQEVIISLKIKDHTNHYTNHTSLQAVDVFHVITSTSFPGFSPTCPKHNKSYYAKILQTVIHKLSFYEN